MMDGDALLFTPEELPTKLLVTLGKTLLKLLVILGKMMLRSGRLWEGRMPESEELGAEMIVADEAWDVMVEGSAVEEEGLDRPIGMKGREMPMSMVAELADELLLSEAELVLLSGLALEPAEEEEHCVTRQDPGPQDVARIHKS